MRTLVIVLGVLAAIAVAGASLFTVDRAEYVYLTRLGRHTATYDGATQAGLYVKWPWPIEAVQHLDRRLEVLDLPATEQLTRDPGGRTIDRTLTVEGFVSWRIADAASVDRFIRTVGTPDRARLLLGQRISSQLSAEIGRMEISDFVSDQPGQVARQVGQLRDRLLHEFHAGAGAAGDYGIEVVDVRLRRYNYPAEVRPAILERIRSEREKKKAEYESEATIKVGKINADSDREVRQIAAEAEARRKQIKGEADAEADRIRNQAFSKDSDFYVFLKKLEGYESILGNNRTVLLLSSHRELFDLLFSPPKPGGRPATNGMPAAAVKVDSAAHSTSSPAKGDKP